MIVNRLLTGTPLKIFFSNTAHNLFIIYELINRRLHNIRNKIRKFYRPYEKNFVNRLLTKMLLTACKLLTVSAREPLLKSCGGHSLEVIKKKRVSKRMKIKIRELK